MGSINNTDPLTNPVIFLYIQDPVTVYSMKFWENSPAAPYQFEYVDCNVIFKFKTLGKYSWFSSLKFCHPIILSLNFNNIALSNLSIQSLCIAWSMWSHFRSYVAVTLDCRLQAWQCWLPQASFHIIEFIISCLTSCFSERATYSLQLAVRSHFQLQITSTSQFWLKQFSIIAPGDQSIPDSMA